jgi:hypothetical protein
MPCAVLAFPDPIPALVVSVACKFPPMIVRLSTFDMPNKVMIYETGIPPWTEAWECSVQ